MTKEISIANITVGLPAVNRGRERVSHRRNVEIAITLRIDHNSLAHDLVTAWQQNTKSAARLDVLRIDSRLSRMVELAVVRATPNGLQGLVEPLTKG
jgi:hypothetical protein